MVPFDLNRCDAFWQRTEVDRPLLSSWIGSFAIVENYPAAMATMPEGELHPSDIRFEAFRSDYETLFVNHSLSDVDVPWAAFPLMTIPWVEAIIGCPIHHRQGNIWASHWLKEYDQFADYNLSPNNPWLVRLIEFTEWLVKISAGRFPVALSLMRGPLDLLSALRGPEQICLDLYDHPQEISFTLSKLTGIWQQIAAAQQAAIPSFEGGYNFSVINLWGKQTGGWYQDDATALWSPRFYRQHLWECERRLAASMPLTGIHLHSVALFQVPDLLQIPELDVIECNIDVGGPALEKFLPKLTPVQEAGKRLVLWGEFSTDDLHLLKNTLSAKGTALQIIASTPAEAQEKVRLIDEIWRR